MAERDWLKEIMEAPLTSIAYESHPADDVLRDYIKGRLDRSGPVDTAGLRAGNLTIWHRAEVTAHLLTCPRCAQLVAEWRTTPSRFQAVWERWTPVPAFVRFAIVAQFAIIVGLVGVIYFKPVLLFPPQNPVASILPPAEVTKPQLQSPQPHEMVLSSPAPPDDPIPQLIQALQSYAHTLRVVFRHDAPAREIETILENMNGMLIMEGQGAAFILLPQATSDRLDQIVQELSQSPYVIEARKD